MIYTKQNLSQFQQSHYNSHTENVVINRTEGKFFQVASHGKFYNKVILTQKPD